MKQKENARSSSFMCSPLTFCTSSHVPARYVPGSHDYPDWTRRPVPPSQGRGANCLFRLRAQKFSSEHLPPKEFWFNLQLLVLLLPPPLPTISARQAARQPGRMMDQGRFEAACRAYLDHYKSPLLAPTKGTPGPQQYARLWRWRKSARPFRAPVG